GTANQANFVIVSYPTMLSAASSLAALRQGQGMQVSVVNLTDVYDEFNYGEKDPSAIKNFLQYTQTKWAKAPRYVMLLGGASVDANDQYNDFEGASASVSSLIPSGFSTQSVLTGQIGGSAARTSILDGFNNGQLVVNYTGHGFEQAWSGSNLLTINDPASLTNA